MKFTIHISGSAEVEAKDEAEALKKLTSLSVAEISRNSTQLLPHPEPAAG